MLWLGALVAAVTLLIGRVCGVWLRALSISTGSLVMSSRLLTVPPEVNVTRQVSDVAGKQVLRGHIDGEDYNLVHAPGLAGSYRSLR